MAVERTTDGVFITDAKAVIEYVNPAFEAMTGYSRDEAIGRPASILRSGLQGQGFYEELWMKILSGQAHSATPINRRRDGSLFHAEQTITPVRDELSNQVKFVSVMRDITELIRAQEQDVEMRLARAVQEKLYPTNPLQFVGFDLAGAAYPADRTCGDYYDFIPMMDGRLGIAMGDVSGHGFSAALLMAETRAYLRSVARVSMNLNDMLSALNAFLFEDTESERFVTLMLVLLDPGRRSIVFSNAGHVDGYVLDDSGNVKHVLGSTGPALGLFGEAEFRPSPEILLTGGDLLLLLTDGIAEARGRYGEFFETERILKVVADARQESASEIIRRLQVANLGFASNDYEQDDISVVVCKVRP
jgi:PAS domain S-box-containing protein